MLERRPERPAPGGDGAMRRADQEARLAAELRRNLLRRKQQQRARQEGGAAVADVLEVPADEGDER